MQMIAPAHNPVRPSGSPQGEARLRWRLISGIVPGINDGSAVTEGRLRKQFHALAVISGERQDVLFARPATTCCHPG
jgi:hypothetical protein